MKDPTRPRARSPVTARGDEEKGRPVKLVAQNQTAGGGRDPVGTDAATVARCGRGLARPMHAKVAASLERRWLPFGLSLHGSTAVPPSHKPKGAALCRIAG